ncbi:short chain dehydrogenase [Tahibacter amnicola]|uniref:Short chain dehydrogenase n=1 Tax=Tahibacter amnicola TaxID=2976241 RepID=A0ABY6BDB0_9GAMM|nr:short chain dehydrogenase [Tahibacter amnicola]UXI67734.1 short chain dehydrogenase [Tahibacter amnicola]
MNQTASLTSTRRPRLLLVGAAGTIGRAVAAELSPRYEVITAGRTSGDIVIDMGEEASIRAGLARAGTLDAIVSTAGNVHFGPLAEMTPAQWQVGLQSKLMGQVTLAMIGAGHLRDGGSITLSAGSLAEQPVRGGSSASLVNGALESFVRAAAIELPRGLRINVVSPSVLQESMPDYGPYFRGYEAVPAARVALAYGRSVEGAQTGQVYKVL